MYVVECIPIARGAHKDSLSYLSSTKITLGTIVEAPLRKQLVPALVLLCTKAEDIKANIRTSEFRLRKLTNSTQNSGLSKNFISAVTKTAEYFASYPGPTFFLLTPKHIFTSKYKKASWKKISHKKRQKTSILQTTHTERLAHYKKLIRESFSKKESVFISVPSIQDGERLHNFLRKGIEKYTIFFHSNLPKKRLVNRWQQALSTKHPVVIIGTPMFLSLPRTDVTRIIIEKESSDGYRTISTPRIDTRIFIKYLAKECGAELIYGDTLLRLETLHQQTEHTLEVLEKSNFRKTTTAHSMLFDMTEGATSLVFHEHSHKIIGLTKQNNEHTFIFAARKGLAPLTICQDCGHVVTSSDGKAPMVLYEHPEGNYFYCPHTKEKRPADTTCSYCGGWRLKPLGLGIDTIEKEVRAIAPETTIFRLDRDSANSHKKAVSIIEKFYETPGSILIGTELASSYLQEVDHCLITTIDSLFSLPDFHIKEKTLRTLLSFKEKALKDFIIQTRNPEQDVFSYVISGNVEEILSKELESREKFGFPPFKTLIKITLQGPESVIEKHAQEIVAYIREGEADIYPAHISKLRGSHILNILFRIPNEDWPDHTLVNKLRAMQTQYRVQVQPENIL